MKYGISRIKYKTEESSPSVNGGDIFVVGRVKDIILDESHPKWDFYGKWNSIGTIFWEDIESPSGTHNSNNLNLAKPYFTNIKNYPLKEEIVLLILGPNLDIDSNIANKEYYYMSSYNIWNSPQHNALPDSIYESFIPKNQQLNYNQSLNNNPKNVDNNLDLLGTDFKENLNVNYLIPYEGDYLIEGRLGGSLRFSQTINHKLYKNFWSNGTKTGSPIVILDLNGKKRKNNSWELALEDINNDSVVVVLSEDQIIPLKLIKTPKKIKYDSENKTPQLLINTDRIILQGKKSLYLLSDKLNLLSNELEIENKSTKIHTEKFIIGDENNVQPLLKGDDTVELMKRAIQSMKNFADVCSNVISSPAGSPIISLNAAALEMSSNLSLLLKNIESVKSKTSYSS